VSTVTIEARPSMWTRVATSAKRWGKRIPAATKKAGNWTLRVARKGGRWVKKAAQWAFEAKATQWVLAKTKPVWSRAWRVIRGPVGWVAGAVGVVALIPKAVAILLIALGILVVIMSFALWRAHKATVKERVYTDAEWNALVSEGPASSFTYTTVKPDGTTETEMTEVKMVKDAKGKRRIYVRKHEKVTTKFESFAEAMEDKDTAEQKFRSRFAGWSNAQLEKDAPAKSKSGSKEAPLVLNGEVTPDETVSKRHVFLDEQMTAAEEAGDSDLYSEAVARTHVVEVRLGISAESKLKRDAKPSAIHREARQLAEKARDELGATHIEWNWDLMYRAAISEAARFDEIVKMQEKLVTAS
jgi:hypothetical protein